MECEKAKILAVIIACVLVFMTAAMAFPNVIALPTGGHPLPYVPYAGTGIPNLMIGWNLIQWFCNPQLSYPNGNAINAEWVCDHTIDGWPYGVEHPHKLITQVSYIDTNGVTITHIAGTPQNNFDIVGYRSYWVLCAEHSGAYWPYTIPIPAGIVPRHYDVQLTANAWNYIGVYYSFTTDFYPPPNPVPPTPAVMWASGYYNTLRNPDHSQPFSGNGQFEAFNGTSQEYEAYVSGWPLDFVIWSLWSDGTVHTPGIHDGWIIWVSSNAIIECWNY